MKNKKQKVLVVGGGFGGLNTAQNLNDQSVDVLLIDKANHHLFQPLLYQVATAALSPGDIIAPIRNILRKQKNVQVIMDEVLSIDPKNNIVYLNEKSVKYDYLVLAPGCISNYYGNNQWKDNAIGLKTINDALRIREKILLSFEKAEKSKSKKELSSFLTFIIIGGGPTGVEIAGAVGELANHSLLEDYSNFKTSDARIILIEASDRILRPFDDRLSKCAEKCLKDLGVEVFLNGKVDGISDTGLYLNGKFIPSENIIWAAGNRTPKFLENINAERDKIGRIKVLSDCSVGNFPNIFLIGDAAHFEYENNKVLPQVAPVAIQQGKFVAKIIVNNILPTDRPSFNYIDKGTLATIGRARAVAQFRKLKFSGFFAWLIWAFVHIISLIGYRNRYKVLTEWVWYYFSYKNGIRLITKE
ncbi:MAG: NAD(P)/FAD-dependent oxidoreductase [Ignavibacteriae bacterium]|nr:NAD(P)/FAD-dependent oxidoreductase [Ignavibacteriota bacterium]NOG99755.1 NAD(P)/FAD-dependent oxidoreductase [Ignavibacteriota bacterium]